MSRELFYFLKSDFKAFWSKMFFERARLGLKRHFLFLHFTIQYLEVLKKEKKKMSHREEGRGGQKSAKKVSLIVWMAPKTKTLADEWSKLNLDKLSMQDRKKC